MDARKLVCFDLDGTLLDPGGSIRASITHAIATEGLEDFSPEEILIGLPLREILRTRTSDEAAIERMMQAFRHYFVNDAWRLVSWYPGIETMLQQCRDAGLQTAIVTTKGEEEATQLLGHLDRADWFDAIVGDDDLRPLKPDPAPVLEACQRLGCAPEHALMVGDTSFDIDAGRAAGTTTIGVRWGSGWNWGAAPTGADVLVEDAEHLWRAIDDWRAGNST